MQVFEPDYFPVEPDKVIYGDNISLESKIYPLESIGKETATKVFCTTKLGSKEQDFSDDKICNEECEAVSDSIKAADNFNFTVTSFSYEYIPSDQLQ